MLERGGKDTKMDRWIDKKYEWRNISVKDYEHAWKQESYHFFFFFFLKEKVVHNDLHSTGPGGAVFTSLPWMMLPCGAAEDEHPDRHDMADGQMYMGSGCLVGNCPAQTLEEACPGCKDYPDTALLNPPLED